MLRRPTSRGKLQLAFRDHDVSRRFRSLSKGRRVKSEVHLLSMLSTKQRRDRLAYLIALHFRWRLHGQYIPSLLFDR